MTTITLEPFIHNAKSCIAIKFAYNFKTKEYIKNFTGVYWTKTHRTFYIYYDEVRLENLKKYITKEGLTLLDTRKETIIPRFRKGKK